VCIETNKHARLRPHRQCRGIHLLLLHWCSSRWRSRRCRTSATAGSRRFFRSKAAASAAASVGPSVQTVSVGLNETPAPQYDLMTDLMHADMFKLLLIGHAAEWGPPDPAREVSKVRISADDGGGYTRRLECWVVLWVCLVLCQVGCVWLARESETQGDSHACHAPDESRVHGVHEDQLPRHSIVGIQTSRNSEQLIRMCALMEVSRLLRTMRTMSRSLRWGGKSAGLKAG
jgi:hypothetical protein